jgi:DNA-binding IclR family transcriptional regulator
MASRNPAPRAARRIQSVEVGFRVIRALEAAEGPLPLKEIARLAAMPASKAHVYLASFAREGLVEQEAATGHYGLGPFAMQLGLAALRQTELLRVAWPELQGLRAATRCTGYLSIWGNRGPVVAAKVDGDRQGSLGVRLGYVLSLRRTATGKVFRAHLPDFEWQALLEAELAEDAGARATRRELEQELAAVRAAGYADSQHRHILGIQAIASPIFDHVGRVVATMTLLGPVELLSGGAASAVVRALIGAAARVSLRLGHPGGDAPGMAAG